MLQFKQIIQFHDLIGKCNLVGFELVISNLIDGGMRDPQDPLKLLKNPVPLLSKKE